MTMKSRLVGAALIAALALPVSALLPTSFPFATVTAHAGILASHETTLASYGTFFEHPKYGKVWMPSANVAPQGWHPYQPCHWVNTKYGWYFQDNTAWGAIVHHYGRWTHEAKLGWMWVPGEEFSPGWVVWRTSEQWVGWAPTPPDQDMKTLDADEFNTDKMWIFMETQKFGKTCGGDVVVAASQVPYILTQTRYVTDYIFVDGILVFVFPPWIVGPIVVIDIDFGVWAPVFIVNVINNWINIWNVVNINVACGPAPMMKPIKPIQSSPPPAPPGRRAETPPNFNPVGNPKPIDRPIINPVGNPKPIDPPNYRPISTGPVYPINPPTVRPNGPNRPIDPPVINRPNGGVSGRPVLTPQVGNRFPGGTVSVKTGSTSIKTGPTSIRTGSTVGVAARATGPNSNLYRKNVM